MSGASLPLPAHILRNKFLQAILCIAWVPNLANTVWATKPAIQRTLIAHWPLTSNARDIIGDSHGQAKSVRFDSESATFDGIRSEIEIADAEAIHLGTSDFSIALWLKCDRPMRNTLGDVLTKFDPISRRGINFHLAGCSPGYNAMSDTRHVHFGIDQAFLGEWQDCGKPSPTNTLITCLISFKGELYCGIADAAPADARAHIFRYAGAREWADCGRLGSEPNHHSVQSMIVHDGKLYAGTGMWDWVQATGRLPEKPVAAATRVFVYEGGTSWRDLGQVGNGTRVLSMGSFDGDLYVGVDNSTNLRRGGGHVYRYQAEKWVDCGAPDGRNLECFLPLHNKLYVSTHGNVYEYQGGQTWNQIGNFPFQISQIHSMEAVAGKIVIGTWPQGYVLEYAENGEWRKIGQLGLPGGRPPINEINDLTIFNGKLYAGAIPKAEVYRFEKDNDWTLLGSLADRSDWDPKKSETWLRLTCMASYQGSLFAGTGSCHGRASSDADPSLGRVYSIRAGHVVSHEHDIGGEWTHLAGVRRGRSLALYVNGKASSRSQAAKDLDVTNAAPLILGFGSQNYFQGKMRDVRLYGIALTDQEVMALYSGADSDDRDSN